MAAYQFPHPSVSSAAPTDWVPVTPHATNALPEFTKGLFITVAGNVVCRFAAGTADRTIPVTAGYTLIGQVTHVRATGTTASGIFALTGN